MRPKPRHENTIKRKTLRKNDKRNIQQQNNETNDQEKIQTRRKRRNRIHAKKTNRTKNNKRRRYQMGKNIIITIYEALKALSITIFIFCGMLTLIIIYYFWTTAGSKQALFAFILGNFGFYQFIKLIYNLRKVKQAGEE